jgi:hypothetical protein
MITLGCFDADVQGSACQAYVTRVEQTTRLPFAQVNSGLDKLTLQKYVPDAQLTMSVADVQRGLKSIGFFPMGAIDGICGYRTQSAIRLFQEYIRSVEMADNLIPDGRFAPKSQEHLKRWMNGGLKSEWTKTMENWRAGTSVQEYSAWLALLENVKQQYQQHPNKMLQKVSAYPGKSSTRNVAQWDFSSPENVHLIGIRRDNFKDKFEDIFVLPINGLVFKFQGSTEPGDTVDPRGYPFLVQGQHEYHFGWHKRTYLALKPQSQVLVIRSKDIHHVDDTDPNKDLEANDSINVHWGGAALSRDVNNWLLGCQVIGGSVYLNPANDLINWSELAATGSQQPPTDPAKTRGAFNVLLDLVVPLSSDRTSALKYMLLIEPDMELDASLKQGLSDARNRVLALL